MNLFELTGQYLALMEMMEDTETDPQTLEDTMAAIEGELEDKADAYAAIRTQLLGQAGIIEAEIERLKRRQGTIEGNIRRLTENLETCMRATGKVKFKTGLHSFNIQRNPASLVLDEQYIENIPDEYLIAQEPKIDRAKMKADLKAGKDLNGICHLEQTESLRIR